MSYPSTSKVKFQESFILQCEHFITLQNYKFAEYYINKFFEESALSIPHNQYIARAYLCQALILATNSQLTNTGYDISAIWNKFAKVFEIIREDKRYIFIAYNSSVKFFEVIRHYLYPGFRNHLTKPIQIIIEALENYKYLDNHWICELYLELVLCNLDIGRGDEVKKLLNIAFSLAINQTILFNKVLLFQYTYQINDFEENANSIDILEEVILPSKLNHLKRDLINISVKAEVLKNEIDAILKLFTNNSLFGNSNDYEGQLKSSSKNIFLAELGIISIYVKKLDTAKQCQKVISYNNNNNNTIKSNMYSVIMCNFFDLLMKLECITTYTYSNSGLKHSLELHKTLVLVIKKALSLQYNDLVQTGCIILWNMSLFLLQPNLKHYLLKNLLDISTILESIRSPLLDIRVSIHREVSLIQEIKGDFKSAINHLMKAISLSYSELLSDKIRSEIQRLNLILNIYSKPTGPIDIAFQMLEQAKCTFLDESISLFDIRDNLLSILNNFIIKDVNIYSLIDVIPKMQDVQNISEDIMIYIGKKIETYVKAKESTKKIIDITKSNVARLCQLLEGLAVLSRKLKFWDICRLSSQICLQILQTSNNSSSNLKVSCQDDKPNAIRSKSIKDEHYNSLDTSIDSTYIQIKTIIKDPILLKILSEVHLYYGESLLHLIYQEVDGLFDVPSISVYNQHSLSECNENWVSYINLIKYLSYEAINAILKSVKLSNELDLQWITINALFSFWNATKHLKKSKRGNIVIRESKEICQIIVTMVKDNPRFSHPQLVYNLLEFYLSTIPDLSIHSLKERNITACTNNSQKSQSKNINSAEKLLTKVTSPGSSTNLDQESVTLLNEAVEFSEFAIVYCIKSEMPLLAISELIRFWVRFKLQLNYYFILEKEYNNIIFQQEFKLETKCIFLINLLELSNCSSISSGVSAKVCFDTLTCSNFNNSLYTLFLWTKLVIILFNLNNDTDLLISSVNHAKLLSKKCDSSIILENKSIYYTLLSIIESSLGQVWLRDYTGKIKLQQIFHQFLIAAYYSDKGNNEIALSNQVKLFWNASRKLKSHENLSIISLITELLILIGKRSSNTSFRKLLQCPINDEQFDIQLGLYFLLLNMHYKSSLWEEGLRLIERSKSELTKYNCSKLIYYKILFKCKSYLSVSSDILYSRDHYKDYEYPLLWHVAALNAFDAYLMLQAYERSIIFCSDKNLIMNSIDYGLEYANILYNAGVSNTDLILLLDFFFIELCFFSVRRHQKLKFANNVDIEFNGIKSEKTCYLYAEDIKFLNPPSLFSVTELNYSIRIFIIQLQLYNNDCNPMYETCLHTCLYLVYLLLITSLTFPNQIPTNENDIQKKKKIVKDKGKFQFFPSSLSNWFMFDLQIDSLPTNIIGTQILSSNNFLDPDYSLYLLFILKNHVLKSEISHFVPIVLTLMNLIALLCNKRTWRKLIEFEFFNISKLFKINEASKLWFDKLSHVYIDITDVHYINSYTKHLYRREIDLKDDTKYESPSHLKNKLLFGKYFNQYEWILYLWLNIIELLFQYEKYQEVSDLLELCQMSLHTFSNNALNTKYNIIHAKFELYLKSYSKALNIVKTIEIRSFDPNNYSSVCIALSDCLPLSKSLKMLNSSVDCIRQARLKVKLQNLPLIIAQINIEVQIASLQIEKYLATCSQDYLSDKRSLIEIYLQLDSIYCSYCILAGLLEILRSYQVLITYYDYHARLASFFKRIDSDKFFNYSLKSFNIFLKIHSSSNSIFAKIRSKSINFSFYIKNTFPVISTILQSNFQFSIWGLDTFLFAVDYRNIEKISEHLLNKSEKLINNFAGTQTILSTISKHFIDNSEIIILYLIQNLYISKEFFSLDSCQIDLNMGYYYLYLYLYYSNNSIYSWKPIEHESSKDTLPLSISLSIEDLSQQVLTESNAFRYLSLSTSYFVLSLISLLQNNTPYLYLISKLGLHLVNVLGLYDKRLVSSILLFFQSSRMSLYLESLLCTIFKVTEQSLYLFSKSLTKNSQSLVNQYPRLSIINDFFEITQNLPNNFRYLMMQHSYDQQRLYYTYARYIPPNLKLTKGASNSSSAWQPVSGMSYVDSECFNVILQLLHAYNNDLLIHLCSGDNRHDTLNAAFQNICTSILAYFSDVISHVTPCVIKECNLSNLDLFIIADHNIQVLPIEILFANSPYTTFRSISRDISLQMISHRFASLQNRLTKVTSKIESKHKEISDRKSKDSIEYDSQMLIDLTKTIYIIDPKNEMEDYDYNEVKIEHFVQIMKFENKSSYQWSGIIGIEQISSTKELEYLLKADNLIFFIPNDIKDLISETNLVLNSNNINALMLMNNLVNSESNRTDLSFIDRMKPNNLKYPRRNLKKDSNFNIIYIFSLLGANVIITNQWVLTMDKCERMFKQIMNNLIDENLNISRSINTTNKLNTKEIVTNNYVITNEINDFLESGKFNTITFGLSNLSVI